METLKSIGKLIAVLFAGLVLLIAWGMYGPVVKNFISPRHFYYTVTADLLIDDQPVVMSGTIECRWVQRPVAPLVTDTSYYRIIGGPVTKRLPDGSGLLLWIGGMCNGRQDALSVFFDQNPKIKATAESNIRLANKQRWYLLHLDDATNPKRITAYIGPDYFRQPHTKIRVLRLTEQGSRKGHVTDFRNDLPWLRKGFWGTSNTRPFLGYFARVIPRDTWEQNAQVSKFLSAAKTPILNVQQALYKAGMSEGVSLALTGGKVIPMTYQEYNLKLSTSDLDKTWAFTLKPVTASYTSGTPNEVTRCNGRFVDWLVWPKPERYLSIDDRTFTEKLSGAMVVFDPVSGLMINIGSLCIDPGLTFP